MAESEAFPKIYLTSLKCFVNVAPNKLFCRQHRQFLREREDDYLAHPEISEPLHLLLKGLEQWRRCLRFEHLARVRIEGDQSRRRIEKQSPFDDNAHDGLMARVKAIK